MKTAITLETLRQNRAEILRMAEEHGVLNIRVFGSVVRGEAGPGSDVDLLVATEPKRSLFDHVAFMQDVGDLLGCEVDVVSEDAVHWFIRDRVFAEAVPL
jgi:uncharacterized protein